MEELLDEEMALLESAPDLVMRDSQDGASLVKGGSLEKLIHFLTSHKLPPADFTSAFLLTYQSFTSARDLLQQLIKRYNVEVPESLSVEQRSLYCARKVIPVRLRVFNVLKMWIKNNYEDFEADSELLALLTDFLPTMKEDFRKGTADFQALLARKAKGGERLYSTHINHQPPAPILPKRLSELTLLDLDPLELARQITIHQWAHFAAIMPNECLNQAWNNKELQHLAPSIMRMIRCSNFVRLVGGSLALERSLLSLFSPAAC